MIQASSINLIAVLLGVATGIAGCAARPDPAADGLDVRLAWPCQRLVVGWAINATQLQAWVDDDLAISHNDSLGELRLSVMRCDPISTGRSGMAPLLFGYVMIPVTADSAPLVITKVPAEGWLSLLHIVADANTGAIFSKMGYDVLAAEISFDARETDSETTVELRLMFENGDIAIDANVTGARHSHDVERALLSSGEGFVSAFFGREEAQRYASSSATVEVHGETPLSGFESLVTPTTTVFDTEFVSDRIFWRLPITPE